MSAPLTVNHLIKNYDDVNAVKNVSFSLKEGEVFGLLGPNGAGKTSIISCIVTLEAPTTGSVEVFGHDVQKKPVPAKFEMGIVPQELIHHGFFSIHEIMEIHSGYYGLLNNSEQIEYLLKKMDLWAHKEKKVRQLSGGMKRRLLLAKSLVHKPRLLLLDEPTAGVDIELRESLWEFVRELKAQGTTVLLTTHYLEEAEMLCDQVGVLSQGSLIKIGETKSLIRELTLRRVSFKLVNSRKIEHKCLVASTGAELIFDIPYTKSIANLFAELSLELKDVSDLSIKEGSLEDAFKKILREDS